MATTATFSNATQFMPGDVIIIAGTTPHLPKWVRRWPFQDGDQAIVRWFYKVVGWPLPTFDGKYTVAACGKGTGVELR